MWTGKKKGMGGGEARAVFIKINVCWHVSPSKGEWPDKGGEKGIGWRERRLGSS